MKFKLYKGFNSHQIHKIEDRIAGYIWDQVSKGFYSKRLKHYVDYMNGNLTIEVNIKKVK